MEAAITARSSCARMAYTPNARATTTISEISHRLYLLTLKMIHFRFQQSLSVPASAHRQGGTKTTLTKHHTKRADHLDREHQAL